MSAAETEARAMASDLFRSMNGQLDQNGLMKSLADLKRQVSDPNQVIQQLLNSGRVTQAQYNSAVQRAQQIMRMLPTSVRR